MHQSNANLTAIDNLIRLTSVQLRRDEVEKGIKGSSMS